MRCSDSTSASRAKLFSSADGSCAPTSDADSKHASAINVPARASSTVVGLPFTSRQHSSHCSERPEDADVVVGIQSAATSHRLSSTAMPTSSETARPNAPRGTALAWLLFALVACGGDQSSGASPGEEKGDCYANGTCNAGLTCFSKKCVRYANPGESDSSAAAGAGGSKSGVAGAPGPLRGPRASGGGCGGKGHGASG